MEVIKLIGVLIVIVGFILKLDTLAVVVVAGLATGLVAGMSPMKILETLGTAFITNRTATLFILTSFPTGPGCNVLLYRMNKGPSSFRPPSPTHYRSNGYPERFHQRSWHPDAWI